MYYVYVDWTTDSGPYPFYVGCGTLNRVGKKYRNSYHRNIAQKHGLNRVIVHGPCDKVEAFSKEVHFIAELRTFQPENPRGANFTRGGEGSHGHVVTMTPEWRARIAASLRGRKSDPEANRKRSEKQRGVPKPCKLTSEQRAALSERFKGVDRTSPEGRIQQAAKLRGRKREPFTEEHKAKIRESIKARWEEWRLTHTPKRIRKRK